MKKFLSLALAFAVSSLGLISLLAQPVRAQQVASAGKSISEIKEEYERLLAVDRDPSTPSEVKELNQQFLEKPRYYESLEGFDPGKTGSLNNSRNRFIGKLRIFPKFLDSNPEGDASTSSMFGVEINAGRGPDQIKFFTGIATAFKLFKN